MIIEDADLRARLTDALRAADPGLVDRLPAEPAAHLDLIALIARLRIEAEAMLHAAVADARVAGCSWEGIGQSLGASPRTARETYADVDQVVQPVQADGTDVVERPGTPEGQGRIMRLSPLYPFNEMPVLENAGRYGWHAVAAGSGMHFVRPSGVQWEHRRVFISPATCRTLEAEGWTRWTPGWFPWGYFNRPTAIPAEPEPPDLDLMHP